MNTSATNTQFTPKQRLESMKKALASPLEERLKVLRRAGIIDREGNLTKRYRPAKSKKA